LQSDRPNQSSLYQDQNSASGTARSNRLSWFILVVLLAFAPLAFGAVEFWSTAVVEFLCLLLALAWLVGAIFRGTIRIEMNSLFWAAVGFQCWVGLQLIRGWTLDAANTREDLLLAFCYFLVFLVVSNETWSTRWIRNLGLAQATIGFLIAMLGIVQFFSWNGKIYWVRAIQVGAPFGPYVNRNHFVGLMEMTFMISMGMALSRGIDKAWKVLLVFFTVVMAVGSLMALSRGGIICMAVGVLLFMYLVGWRQGVKRSFLMVVLVAFVSLGLLVYFGVDPLVQRIFEARKLTQEASFMDRLYIARDTLSIVQEHPYMGTGLGTFALVSPIYMSFYRKYLFDKAHNDYLQLLSEVGLIGFFFAVWWIVGLVRIFFKIAREKSRRISAFRTAAFCGCISILVHSTVDFNLQIPANALFFAVLAALVIRSGSTQLDRPVQWQQKVAQDDAGPSEGLQEVQP